MMTSTTESIQVIDMMHQHPNSNITEPHANDVLSGRGAGITKHPGNKRWRELIRNNRQRYTSLPRNQRPIIAESIVKAVRSLTPPGRFLTKDPNSQLWYDIGDERATEKTAQAMRDSKKSGNNNSSTSASASGRKEQPSSSSPAVSPAVSPSSSPSPPRMMMVAPPPVPVVPAAPPVPAAATTATSNATNDDVQCSPKISKPEMKRLNTDDTFSQRMDGFAFLDAPLLLQREPSAILLWDGESNHNHNEPTQTAVKCSPNITKPLMARDNTFDKRLEQLNCFSSFHSTNTTATATTITKRPSRQDSIFSMASFDMLAEDEFELLEASCGMPSSQQRISHNHGQFYADIIEMDHIEEDDGDVVMEDAVSRPSIRYAKRTFPSNHAFHFSF